VVRELEELEATRTSELMKLREQIDGEYKRQLSVETARIEEIREQELLAQRQLQSRFEKLDSKWTTLLIAGFNERLWQLISDRAALFGVGGLKDNPEFKKDVSELTSRAMQEEFALRRTKILETATPPESLLRKRRFKDRAKTYCGWAAAVVLLGFMVSGVIKPDPNPRAPASVPQLVPVR
jgi:hypothetical protein